MPLVFFIKCVLAPEQKSTDFFHQGIEVQYIWPYRCISSAAVPHISRHREPLSQWEHLYSSKTLLMEPETCISRQVHESQNSISCVLSGRPFSSSRSPTSSPSADTRLSAGTSSSHYTCSPSALSPAWVSGGLPGPRFSPATQFQPSVLLTTYKSDLRWCHIHLLQSWAS